MERLPHFGNGNESYFDMYKNQFVALVIKKFRRTVLEICSKFLRLNLLCDSTLPRMGNNDNFGDQQVFIPLCIGCTKVQGQCVTSIPAIEPHMSLPHFTPSSRGRLLYAQEMCLWFCGRCSQIMQERINTELLVARAVENGLQAGRAIPYPGMCVDKLTGCTLSKPLASRTCRSCSEKHLLREIRKCGKIPTLMG